MKIENLIGIGLIGVLVWQISRRNGGSAAPTIFAPAAPRQTRWEDVAVQGIQTVGQVTETVIRNQQASAANSAQCRANARQQVADAQRAGVTVAGDDWASVEDQIYQACVAGIS